MRHTVVVVAFLAAALAGPARAQGGTATDQAVSLTYDILHWDASPTADLLGADPDPLFDPLVHSGWWYRAEGDTREYPLPAPTTQTYADGAIVATWLNVHGKGFDVQEKTWVFDYEGPSGGFFSYLGVRHNGPAPRQFTVFHYLDLEVPGPNGGDTGVLVPAAVRFLKFSDGPRPVRYKAYRQFAATVHFKVAAVPALRNLLNNDLVTTLDDSGVPFGPGDASAAFQFGPQAVLPDPLYYISLGYVSFSLGQAADRVKGDASGVLGTPMLWTQDSLQLSDYRAHWLRRTTQLPGFWFSSGVVPSGHSIMGVDDFDGDLLDEPVTRDLGTGELRVGGVLIDNVARPTPNWKLAASGDFNGDGKADLVWRNTTSQKVVIWTMNGHTRVGAIVPSPDQAIASNWDLAAAADFNGDGWRDLLWFNTTSGKLVLWYMDSAVVRITGVFTTPDSVGSPNWRPVAVGDFGKGPALDGTPLHDTQDIVWQNLTSKKIVVWHMDHSAQRTGGLFTTPDTLDGGRPVVGPR